jgi:hypothetical protein
VRDRVIDAGHLDAATIDAASALLWVRKPTFAAPIIPVMSSDAGPEREAGGGSVGGC